jgi:fatty acid kinase
MTASRYLSLVIGAASALKARKEEVNRLNVFPVPDGDTGTNMSLTIDVVVEELSGLSPDASIADACHVVTHASLLGARGNSGVILSQVLRGLCEGIDGAETFDTELLASALERSVVVAFQAVRKPVEGTILTVLRDTADAARSLADAQVPVKDALSRASAAAFDSVRRTPDLLPVLKENGVVDAGGFGLAVLFQGFVAAALGQSVQTVDVSVSTGPLKVVPVDDWSDTEYLYCTEFLLFGKDISPDAVRDYVSTMGGSELVVGSDGEFKVHVHTDEPGAVLSHMTQLGEVADVHINNMRRQTQARDSLIMQEKAAETATNLKPVGFVAVAAGAGLAAILESLGIDEVVSGGQTMNPSTRDLVEAINRVPAANVIVLPNNQNIIMTANAAVTVTEKSAAVVPTTTIPQAFSAMLAYDDEVDFPTVVASMTEAATHVRSGEVTVAIKNAKGKAGRIKAGQMIGIVEHEVELVGKDVKDVSLRLADLLIAPDSETLTVLAGEDLTDDELSELVAEIGAAHPKVAIEAHRGDQPVYHVIMAAE